MIPLLSGVIGVSAGTYLAGWLAVPVVGAVVGGLGAGGAPVRTAALSGAGGWAVLLALGAVRGPVAEVANLTGDVLGGMPGYAFLAVALLLPAVLAGAAGGAASALVEIRRRRTAGRA